VATNSADISVVEKIRRRAQSEVSSDQQISSREKLKQIAKLVDGKLPYTSVDDAVKSLRRYEDDHD
jgi:hypothetical protein